MRGASWSELGASWSEESKLEQAGSELGGWSKLGASWERAGARATSWEAGESWE